MHSSGGGHNGSRLEDQQLRLVLVDAPEHSGPLIDALDLANVGTWMWIESERVLYLSTRLLELHGIAFEPREDLLTRYFQCVHADEQEPLRHLLLGTMPAGPFRLHYRFTPPGGPLRWMEDLGRVERDDSGALIRQCGIVREVTHEVGRQLEMREADARLEALLNAMPFAVWGRSGPDLTVTHQNAQSVADWGDMRGRPLSDVAPEVREIWERQLADVMTGEIVRGRREYLVCDEPRAVDEIIAPVIVEDCVTGAVGIAIDVSAEARASRFQAVMTEIAADFAGRSNETLSEGLVLALEKVARFLGAPLAVLCEITQSAQTNLLRVTHWWVDPASGSDRPRLLEVETSAVSGVLQQVSANAALIIRSREELPLDSPARAWFAEHGVQSFAMVPMPQLDGTRTLLGLAGRDDSVVEWPSDTEACMRFASTLLGAVVARARADADEKAVQRRMQDAQRLESLGVLAGGIAHDFNNLLTAILGNASLLRVELPVSESTAEAIGQIESASRRAAELCRQMLAYAGRGRFALQTMDLNELLRDMRAVLEVTVPRTAALELALAPSLPPVLGDEGQIRQLIMNLVFNAAEALHEQAGRIRIATSVAKRTSDELASTVFSPELPEGTYVSLTITDTGTGMAPETAERIFDPFFSTKFTGRGLGLAAVVGIVRSHQGALRVESEVGTGSTFELMLPAQEGPALPPVEAMPPATHASLVNWRTTGTALVVDDERGVRELVRSVLERAGLYVVLAENGEQALETFKRMRDQIRVVLVDLTMPGLDGRETLAEMRKQRADLPAILMSGYSPADLLNSSAHRFLQKPFTPAALRALVKQVLGE